ncbi:15027_t:CDS:2 [Funneliformis caledonium]|uniref:Dihydrofolate synthetase n=1 Tax=Funneliformis caledonium TaxID=1117310 RepID=A0A9N9HAJ8_9GLOM|nr:15027_t:CDS:2 [Funneliformis caledonium]
MIQIHQSEQRLERINSLLALLNNPHKRLSVIHIAGTNGKGSVSAYLDSILIQSGHKTGRFNSPHFLEPHDSIKINGFPISQEDFKKENEFITDINLKNNVGASSFEILTAIALYWFDKRQIDIAIIEVGMGGRLDATNVFDNVLLSIITLIGMDHEMFLGDNIESIAKEKAGIMKANGNVVVAPQIEKEAVDTLKKCADEIGCTKTILVESAKWEQEETGLALIKLLDHSIIRINIPLSGNIQLENSATAIIAIDLLRTTEKKFANITNEHIINGISSTKWPGRLQWIDAFKLSNVIKMPIASNLLIDGAHNPQAAKALRTFVNRQNKNKVHWIFAATKGKNIIKIFELLLKDEDSLIAVSFSKVEGMPWINCYDPNEIIEYTKNVKKNINTFVAEDIKEALIHAYSKYNKEGGLVVLCGSLYLIADLFKFFQIND